MMTAIEGLEIKQILESEDPLFEWVGLADKYQLQIVSDIYSSISATDALAIASAKAENALMALLDILEGEGFYTNSELGAARAALRELTAALRQYEDSRERKE